MLSGLSFWSDFFFSINSLILSGFPLTSFHLPEASLSVFYTRVCAVVQRHHEISFIYKYSHLKYKLILLSTCFICTN